MSEPNESSPFGDALEYSSFASDIDLTRASSACRAARHLHVLDVSGGTWLSLVLEGVPELVRHLKVTAGWALETQVRKILATGNGAVTKSAGGPAVTITGTPAKGGSGIITITKAGARGTAEFSWSYTTGPDQVESGSTVLTAATVVLGTTGLTANFPVGTYELGETYVWSSTATNVSRVAVMF